MTPRTELRAFHVSDMTGQLPTGEESRVRRPRGAATACAFLTALGALFGMLSVFGATPRASFLAAPATKPGPMITFDVACVKQQMATHGNADVVALATLVASECEVTTRSPGHLAAAPIIKPDSIISLDASCVQEYWGACEGMDAASRGILVASKCGVTGQGRGHDGATTRFAFVPVVGRPAGAQWPALPARTTARNRPVPAVVMQSFLGVGPAELVVVGIAGYLLLGPKQMMQLARDIGKVAQELKPLRDEFTKNLQGIQEPFREEFKQGMSGFEEAGREMQAAANPQEATQIRKAVARKPVALEDFDPLEEVAQLEKAVAAKEPAMTQEPLKIQKAVAAKEAPAEPSPTSPSAEPLPASSTPKKQPKKLDLTDM